CVPPRRKAIGGVSLVLGAPIETLSRTCFERRDRRYAWRIETSTEIALEALVRGRDEAIELALVDDAALRPRERGRRVPPSLGRPRDHDEIVRAAARDEAHERERPSLRIGAASRERLRHVAVERLLRAPRHDLAVVRWKRASTHESIVRQATR